MKTMPDNYPGPHPPGERRVTCGCGFEWYRSVCVKSDEGIWLCPDEQDGGRTATTLNRLNQQAAMAARPPFNRGPTDW